MTKKIISLLSLLFIVSSYSFLVAEDVAQLERLIEEHESKLGDLKRKLESAKEKDKARFKIEKDLEKLTDQLDAAKSYFNNVAMKVKEEQMGYSQINNALDDLISNEQTLQSEINEMRRESKEIEVLIIQKKERLDYLEEKIDSTEKDLKDFDKRKDEYEKELGEALKKLAKSKEKEESAQSIVTGLENDINNEIAKLAELKNKGSNL